MWCKIQICARTRGEMKEFKELKGLLDSEIEAFGVTTSEWQDQGKIPGSTQPAPFHVAYGDWKWGLTDWGVLGQSLVCYLSIFSVSIFDIFMKVSYVTFSLSLFLRPPHPKQNSLLLWQLALGISSLLAGATLYWVGSVALCAPWPGTNSYSSLLPRNLA